MQFILHASLDSVDAKLWQTPGMSHTQPHSTAQLSSRTVEEWAMQPLIDGVSVSVLCEQVSAARRSLQRPRHLCARHARPSAHSLYIVSQPSQTHHNQVLIAFIPGRCMPHCAVTATATEIRMLLLHDQRLDDNVARAFLFDCYDLYVKVRYDLHIATNLPRISCSIRSTTVSLFYTVGSHLVPGMLWCCCCVFSCCSIPFMTSPVSSRHVRSMIVYGPSATST